MEYNSGGSMILPDTINLNENDPYDEDIVHEQANQNEIVELIMAAFEGQEEPSDGEDDDDESSNTSDSSHHNSDEKHTLHIQNNNNYHIDELNVQQNNELMQTNHSYRLFSNHALSTRSPLGVPSTDIHEINVNDIEHLQHDESNHNNEKIYVNGNSPILIDQNNNRSSSVFDPLNPQYFYQTSSVNLLDVQNQLNKLRILCSVKDRKASQLENLCEEYREKYESELRTFKHQLLLSERSHYDWEQNYQLLNKNRAALFETNNQLQRTVKNAELRIQQLEATAMQMEKKFSDSESFADTLQRKLSAEQHFESIAQTQQNYELILATMREKHEQELVTLDEKLQNAQKNLQEKNVEINEIRSQLELVCKGNEKVIFERAETINQLNAKLHDCQQNYADLLTKSSLESSNQIEIKQQLTNMTQDKEKLEYKCQELQSEIRTLRERPDHKEYEINNKTIKNSPIDNHYNNQKFTLVESTIDQNIHLKQRIDEFVSNEKHLLALIGELQSKTRDQAYSSKRTYSSSSSSSNETVITTSIHMEKIQDLTEQVETLKKNYADLEEKYEYEKHELQTMIEQLREEVTETDKVKQFYNGKKFSFLSLFLLVRFGLDLNHEASPTEDMLRTKFEFELKSQLDTMRRILQEDHNENISSYKKTQEKLEQENQDLKIKANQDLEQKTRELRQEMDAMKVKHEKQIIQLNNEIDRLKTNEDANSRLAYVEKEFEQLKHDYYDLNLKQKDLLKSCSTLENQNQILLNSAEKFEQEKIQLKQTFKDEGEKLLNEIKELNELNQHQKEELLSIHKHSDSHNNNLKQDIELLEARINNYENAITQYEEFRAKLEKNLERITEHRDKYKADLKLTQEMLRAKGDEYDQLKLHIIECEKQLQDKQHIIPYETTINDLQKQIKQYELQIHELKQTRIVHNEDIEVKYREKFMSVDVQKSQLEQNLQEANRALHLADCHLQQEISKIKVSLEQEYNRRYENDQKRYQNDLNQLRQQLAKEIDNKRSINHSMQDTDELKKMYRTEIDRLYRENLDLSQHQAKLIDAHQKQMQIMKKELDDGYTNLITEVQREQTRLQARCDQLKQQLLESQQIIEQLKSSLNRLKNNRVNDLSKVTEVHVNEKMTSERANNDQIDDLQNRIKHFVKLLEESNDKLNQERAVHAKQSNEYQQTVASLQAKMNDMLKRQAKPVDEIKHEYQHARVRHQRQVTPRPISTTESIQTNSSDTDTKTDAKSNNEIFRAHIMDNLEISMKKQIQNELIRNRNSMIKEIRREIFEKLTYALRSQKVPDTTIDMHIFELDRLLSQLAQDCLDSFPSPSSSVSNSSILSIQINPQHRQNRTVIYDSSLANKSKVLSTKSIECLYLTPATNKQPAPLAPHCRAMLDEDRRPKSASNILEDSQNPAITTILSPNGHKFQRSQQNKYLQKKMHRSENDIMSAVQPNAQQKPHLNNNHNIVNLYENGRDDRHPTVRTSAKELERKSNSSSDIYHAQTRPPNIHYATARPIVNDEQEQEDDDDDDELTWPNEPISSSPSTQRNGIKKLVCSGLKLFITQSPQHKRSGK
ncbi:unnamed protein product [Rotaria socialis]